MSLEAIQQQMTYLKFQYTPDRLGELADTATKAAQTPLEFFEQLLTLEIEYREARRIATSLKVSGLPKGMHLDNFDYLFQPAEARDPVETLATGDFIRRNENVLFFGPPGVGLDARAIERGYSVIY